MHQSIERTSGFQICPQGPSAHLSCFLFIMQMYALQRSLTLILNTHAHLG